jgi:hypothetical protein
MCLLPHVAVSGVVILYRPRAYCKVSIMKILKVYLLCTKSATISNYPSCLSAVHARDHDIQANLCKIVFTIGPLTLFDSSHQQSPQA